MAVPQILSDADYGVLNRVLQGCTDLACIVEKMKKAGYPVEDLEAQLKWQHDTAAATKAAFFPDRP